MQQRNSGVMFDWEITIWGGNENTLPNPQQLLQKENLLLLVYNMLDHSVGKHLFVQEQCSHKLPQHPAQVQLRQNAWQIPGTFFSERRAKLLKQFAQTMTENGHESRCDFPVSLPAPIEIQSQIHRATTKAIALKVPWHYDGSPPIKTLFLTLSFCLFNVDNSPLTSYS